MMIGADKGTPAWYALDGETSFLFIDISSGFLCLMKTIDTLLRCHCFICYHGKSFTMLKIEEFLRASLANHTIMIT